MKYNNYIESIVLFAASMLPYIVLNKFSTKKSLALSKSTIKQSLEYCWHGASPIKRFLTESKNNHQCYRPWSGISSSLRHNVAFCAFSKNSFIEIVLMIFHPFYSRVHECERNTSLIVRSQNFTPEIARNSMIIVFTRTSRLMNSLLNLCFSVDYDFVKFKYNVSRHPDLELCSFIKAFPISFILSNALRLCDFIAFLGVKCLKEKCKTN